MRTDGTHIAALFGVLAVWAVIVGLVVTGVVLLVRYMRKRARLQEEILEEVRRQNRQ